MQIDQLRSDSTGKWPGIFERLGIDVGTGKHKDCPACGGKDRFKFDDKEGNGSWYCNQCDPHAGDGFALIQKVLNMDFPETIKVVAEIVGTVEPSKYQKEKPVSPDYLRKIFIDSAKIKNDDPVYRYLKNRGLSSLPGDVRTTWKCWEPETKKDQIAMLAIFRQSDGTAVTIHRTYIGLDDEKLKIESPKKILPPLKPMTGGAVRLFEPVDGQIAITEGIETAIAVYETTGLPTWAALSSVLLAGFEPPEDIKSILIYADNDKNFTGQKAAYSLANKLSLKNIITDVELPLIPGTDFLDEMRSK